MYTCMCYVLAFVYMCTVVYTATLYLSDVNSNILITTMCYHCSMCIQS